MNNKKIKIATLIMCIILLLVQMPMVSNVLAASGTVSVGSASGQVGEQVDIDINVSSDTEISSLYLYIKYDASVVKAVSGFDAGGLGTVQILDTNMDGNNKTYTITFEILSVGSSDISIISDSSYGASSDGETRIVFSTSSGTITGEPAPTYSSDNDLSSLEISPGVLSPAFSAGRTEYTSAVEHDVDVLNVSAIANDDKATVRISGTHLDYGSNTVTITVTAENGSVKKYYIYVTREDATDEPTENDPSGNDPSGNDETKDSQEDINKVLSVKVDGVEYKINNDFELHPLPEGFNIEDYSYKNVSLKIGRGINNKLILMYLEHSDDKNKSGFFVYDSVNEYFYKYVSLSLPAKNYIVLPINKGMEIPAGYEVSVYEYNGVSMQILKNSNSEYCLFYGIDSDGNQGWYTYDYKSRTIQKFYNFSDADKVVVEDENKSDNLSDKKWQIIAICAMAFAIICLIIAIVCAVKLRKTGNTLEADNTSDKESESKESESEELEEDILLVDEDVLAVENDEDVLNVEEIQIIELELEEVDDEDKK